MHVLFTHLRPIISIERLNLHLVEEVIDTTLLFNVWIFKDK